MIKMVFVHQQLLLAAPSLAISHRPTPCISLARRPTPCMQQLPMIHVYTGEVSEAALLVLLGWVFWRLSKICPVEKLESLVVYYQVLTYTALMAYTVIGDSATYDYLQFSLGALVGCMLLLLVVLVDHFRPS